MFRRHDRRDDDGVTDETRPAAHDEGRDELVEGDLPEFDDELEGEDEPEDMTADLESQAADYLAGNDVWMYGPSAEAVLKVLDRLEEMTPVEARPLAQAWLEVPKSDRDHARKAVRKLYEADEEIARHLQLAREAVGTWMAVTAGYPEFVKAETDWARICNQAGEAALDATTALILEESLEEADFEALYVAWSETTAQLDEAAEAARVAAGDEAPSGDEDLEEDDEEDVDEEEAAFGPNSDAVADFLNRLWLLTPEQVGRLVSGWQDAPRDELQLAHESLQALVDEDPDYRGQVRQAQKKLTPWLNAGRVEETAGFLGQAGQGESRKMAGPALADAVAALVLGDLLDPADAEVLYGPWFNLIGAPPLPELAEEDPAQVAAKPAAPAKGSTSAKGAAPARGAGTPKGTVPAKGAAAAKKPAPAKTPAAGASKPTAPAKGSIKKIKPGK
jgi:hypothetical protein